MTFLHVGRKVQEFRRSRKLTPEQFAEKAGVSVTYIRRIENAGVNLTLRSLVHSSNLLQVPITRLFDPPETTASRPGRPRKPGRPKKVQS